MKDLRKHLHEIAVGALMALIILAALIGEMDAVFTLILFILVLLWIL